MSLLLCLSDICFSLYTHLKDIICIIMSSHFILRDILQLVDGCGYLSIFEAVLPTCRYLLFTRLIDIFTTYPFFNIVSKCARVSETCFSFWNWNIFPKQYIFFIITKLLNMIWNEKNSLSNYYTIEAFCRGRYEIIWEKYSTDRGCNPRSIYFCWSISSRT